MSFSAIKLGKTSLILININKHNILPFFFKTGGQTSVCSLDELLTVVHCKSRPSQYELHIPWKELDLFAWGRQS